MGAFPEDCEIEVQKLINLWVAEGFLEKRTSKNSEGELVIHSSSVNLEQEAECYLEDLIDRSLVLVGKRSFSGKIRTCRIHDILRELCLREARKEKFMHMIKRDSQGFPSGISNQRRISFSSDFWGDLNSIPPMLYVRSFLCFSLGSGFIPDFMFFQLGFKLLRVLDIVFLRFEYFPVQLLKLVHLRYLAFTVTYELPVAVSKLRYLQTLIIHGPWIRRESWESTTLLLEYWNMPWLRYLHMTEACCLGIPFIDKRNFISRRISCLQKLSTITFASCTFKVFASMPSLKKLGICETKVDYSTDGSSKCLSNVLHLKKLEELKCTLYVQTRESRCISSWNFPSYLRKLTLSWSYMPWENMTHIAKLVHLEVLKLKNQAFQGTEWEPSEESFPRLKHLLIEKNNLAHWIVTSIHFPSLEHLALRSCPFLEEIPFAVGEIPTLQLIEVHYCSKSAELSAKEIQEQIDGLDVDIRSGWQENNDRNYV